MKSKRKIDIDELQTEVIKAILNPSSWAGAKGDRKREVWQSHVVMFVFAYFVEGKPNPATSETDACGNNVDDAP